MNFENPPPQSQEPKLRAWALVLGGLALATFLRGLVNPMTGDYHPFLFYYGAVVVAARYGGWGPALWTTGLGCLVADWPFLSSRHELASLTTNASNLVD